MTTKQWLQCLGLTTVVVVLNWLGVTQAATPLTVGVYQNKPKVFQDEQGNPQGFWIDLLDEIATTQDWEITYRVCDWDDCLDQLAADQLDLMLDVAYSADRDRIFDFNDTAVLASWSVTYARPGLSIDSILDFDQRRIAVVEDSIQADLLQAQIDSFDIQPTLVLADDFVAVFELIDAGQADAGLVNRFFGAENRTDYRVRPTEVIFEASRLYFAVPEARHPELLAAIDRELDRLKADPDSAYYQALERWLMVNDPTPVPVRVIGLTVFTGGAIATFIILFTVLQGNRALNQEVGQRRQLEATLRDSELRYRQVVEAQSDFVLRSRPDTTITFANSALCRVLGQSPQNVVGQKWISFANSEDLRVDVLDKINRLTPASPTFFAENRDRRADGTWGWTQWLNQGIFNAAGELIEIQSVGRDITALKQVEARLNAENVFRQQVLEHITEGICVCQATDTWPFTRFTVWNPQMEVITGYSLAEINHMEWSDILPDPKLKARAIDRLSRVYAGDHLHHREWQIQSKDGQIRLITISTTLLERDTTQPCVLAMIQDITDRQQAEQRLQALADNMPGVIFRYVVYPDGEYTFTYMSPGCIDIWEYSAEQLVADVDLIFTQIHPDDLEPMNASIQASAENLTMWKLEWRINPPSGQQKWLQGASKPYCGLHGEIIWEGLIFDITERKQAVAALQESEQRFQNMAANVPGAIFRYALHADGTDTVNYMSPGCLKLWEVPPDAVLNDASILWNMVHPDDRPAMQATVMQSAQTLQTWEFQWRIITPSGQTKWLEASGQPQRQQDGTVVWDTLITDVTERHTAALNLAASEARLRLVTENMSDLVCLHDRQGVYLYVTPSCQSLLGYEPDALIDRNWLDFVHPEDRDQLAQRLQAPSLLDPALPILYRMSDPMGDYIWLETLVQPIAVETGGIIHIQTTSRDVSDRVQIEEQLRYEALHDALTGLPNRTLLIERLELALKRLKRDDTKRFAVLFLDLDHFKVINDSLGHLAGDQLLIQVSQTLSRFVRETDLAARLGGDEFVILLEDIQDDLEVQQVGERIAAALRSPFTFGERQLLISASIGIVMGNINCNSSAELLRDADIAMYRSKNNGRNQATVFDPTMHYQVLKRLHLEDELRRAIEHQEFVLYYQPIVALDTQKIQGVETLIRWQHHDRGLVLPGEFITVAEETDLIIAIGHWALNAACHQVATWRKHGVVDDDFKVSVNLSPKQLNESLIQDLDAVLTQSQLPGRNLTLEITESLLVQNVMKTDILLKQIKARGVQVSLDDFGTGYSSLSYLHQLPVDILKVDRAFVNQLEVSATRHSIVKTILTLGQTLALTTVAEGIETPDQLHQLQTLGCDLGQGYLFAPPISAAAIERCLLTPSNPV